MGKNKYQAKIWVAGSLAAVMIGAMAMVAVSSGASASTRVVHRPHALVQRAAAARTNGPAEMAYPVTTFSQQFNSNTNYFCPAGSGNAACDGAPGDYGTIDRVVSQFSNGGYGNYAPSTVALSGNWMALVSGTGDVNQGTGCTSSAVEACTGPYALFGTGAAAGVENVFPNGGFTVTDDLYLSPTSTLTNGTLVDDDVELNSNSGGFGIDNIITACYENTGFVINFGNNSPGSCSGTPVITTDGWYRFIFDFQDVGGSAFLTEFVRSEPGASSIATSGSLPVGGTASATTNWGGPGYFWLPTEQISGLPLANFALQLGNHPSGHTP
jgi:hypothetical protein